MATCRSERYILACTRAWMVQAPISCGNAAQEDSTCLLAVALSTCSARLFKQSVQCHRSCTSLLRSAPSGARARAGQVGERSKWRRRSVVDMAAAGLQSGACRISGCRVPQQRLLLPHQACPGRRTASVACGACRRIACAQRERRASSRSQRLA